MSFDQDLTRKIAARESALSPATALRDAKREAAERRVVVLLSGVRTMLAGMEASPVFGRLMGTGLVPVVTASDMIRAGARVTVEGLVAHLTFRQEEPLLESGEGRPDELRLSVLLTDYKMRGALGCGAHYGNGQEPNGTTADVDGFMVACEDFVAEFLADVAVTDRGRGMLSGVEPVVAAPPPRPAVLAPPPPPPPPPPVTTEAFRPAPAPAPAPVRSPSRPTWTRRGLLHVLSWLRPGSRRGDRV